MQVCPSTVKEIKWCGKCWVIRSLGIRIRSSPDAESKNDNATKRRFHPLTRVEQVFFLPLDESAIVWLCYSPARDIEVCHWRSLLWLNVGQVNMTIYFGKIRKWIWLEKKLEVTLSTFNELLFLHE